MIRRSRKSAFAAGCAALALVVSGVGVGPTASAGVDGESFDGDDVDVTLRWRPCFDEVGPQFECATARVPLDYDRLDAGKIPIDLVRIPATGDKQGSLFLNPGGPGGSGIDFVLGAGPFLYTPEVRAAYDLVGFDPRGIARSNPLLCFGTLNAAFQGLAPFNFPTNDDEEKLQQRVNGFLQTQCRRDADIIINKMSTANVARDLEVLRAAVGDEQLNFAGYSYGSVIGQIYANLFPDRVGHVIIDGVIDIEDWVGDPGPLVRDDETLNERLRSDLGAEDTLAEFFRLCDLNESCAIGPDSEARTMSILDQLEDQTVFVTDPETGEMFPVGYSDVIGFLLGNLYSTDGWIFIGFALADLEFALPEGGPALSRAVEALRDVSRDRRPDPRYPNFVEGFPGVTCVDTSNPPNFRAWGEAADRLSVESPTFGAIWTWGDAVCNRWPGDDRDRFVGPFRQETANPLLVLSTRFDPATSLQQAESARDKTPGSALVTVDGAGHTTLFTSTCVDELTAGYLLDDVLPADGTICAQDQSIPFEFPTGFSATGRGALMAEILGG